MKKTLVVHTQNKEKIEEYYGQQILVGNRRFGQEYLGAYNNYDRLTIVGMPSESDNTLSIGVAFCSYPDNFSRAWGTAIATNKAKGLINSKPYAVVELDEFTQEAALRCLYAIHDNLVKMTVKEVKKLVATQIVK